MDMVESAHVNRYDAVSLTMTAAPAAHDTEIKSVLQSPFEAVLDVPDVFRTDGCRRTLESSFSVLDQLLFGCNGHQCRELRQRCSFAAELLSAIRLIPGLTQLPYLSEYSRR